MTTNVPEGNTFLDVVGGPDFAALLKRKDITEIYVIDYVIDMNKFLWYNLQCKLYTVVLR